MKVPMTTEQAIAACNRIMKLNYRAMNLPAKAICVNVPKEWEAFYKVYGLEHPKRSEEVTIIAVCNHFMTGNPMFRLAGYTGATYGASNFVVLPSMDAETMQELEKESIIK